MNTEAQNPQGAPKKGMSKGCLVTIIVVSVLAVMVVIAGLVCYLKREDIAKAGIQMGVQQVKTNIVQNGPEGMDTVVISQVTAAFIERYQADEFDPGKLETLGQVIQELVRDEDVTTEDAEDFVEALVDYYPDLADLVPSGFDDEADDATDGDDSVDDSATGTTDGDEGH